jgi:transposase
VVAEKRLPNELPKIFAFLSPWREELAGVVVESTFNWYWLVDGLQAAGFTLHLANITAIKKYDGLKHRFYERKKARTNSIVALKALDHKLARACFHILKERKPFDVNHCFA